VAARASTAPLSPADTRPLAGILLMLAAMSLVPLMDGVAKFLSGHYPVLQVVWARYAFHFLLLLPLVLWRHGPVGLHSRRPGLQLLRGLCLLGSTVLFFAAISRMPIADALSLVFVAPLVVTAASPWVLGETVGVRRWSAVIVGFMGALIIIRPGFASVETGTLLALGAGLVYACYVLVTRRLSGSDAPLTTLLYTGGVGALLTSLILPGVWTPPTLTHLGLMAAMGALAISGHFLIIRALDQAPASLLSPYSYSEIVMATVVGYVVFGDFPDAWTWAGIAVVVGSGVYIAVRERQLAEAST